MASSIFICVILMAITAGNVASTSTKRNFPLKDCVKNDIDMLSLLDYDIDQTWENQHWLIQHLSNELTLLSPNRSSSRWMIAAVVDQFSAHNTTIDVADWSFHTYNHSSMPYAMWDPENLEIPTKNVNTALELKIQCIQRLFNEMSGVRKHAIHVGVVFLNGTSLTQEEIRNVSYIVQQQNTDVRIFVVIFGSQLVEEIVHLTDTIVLPNRKLKHFQQYLLMAMCKRCCRKWFSFQPKTGIKMFSCYRIRKCSLNCNRAKATSLCNIPHHGYLAGVETEEEMTVLRKHLIKQYNMSNKQIYIGLQKDLSNYAKLFQWVTAPGRSLPLLINHWLHGKPCRECIDNNCGVWRFTSNWTNDQNSINVLQNITSYKDTIVDGWTDVNCHSDVTQLALCEVVLPERINNTNLVIITSDPAENITSALEKGNLLTYQNNIVSVSANVANPTFLQFLRDSNIHFPIFDCGEDAGDRRYISYSMVCDFVDHCSNRHDELSCFNLQKIFGKNDMYCSSGKMLQRFEVRCDNAKDCKGGSDEENCIGHSCKRIRCDDGSCLPPQWFNDGEVECFSYKYNSSYLIVNDENLIATEYLPNNRSCALFCNSKTCIDMSQLNDGVINCTVLEGPLEETTGQLEPANTCRHILGDFIWAPKCHYMKDMYGGIIGCRDMSHLRDCKDFQCSQGYVKCYNSYCISEQYLRDGKSDCPTGEDEQLFYTGPCTGHFACWDSTICCHPDLVCDGHADCPHGDDELDCHTSCPEGFRCIAGTVTLLHYNKSVPLNMGSLSALDIRTRHLDLSGAEFYGFYKFFFANKEIFFNLKVLILSHCNIGKLFVVPAHDSTTDRSFEIQKLDISYNAFKAFGKHEHHQYYKHINYLNLSYNRQLTLVNHLQFGFLEILDLSYTRISHLKYTVFGKLPRLEHLNLSHTWISDFSRQYFRAKVTLQTLDLRGIHTEDFHDYIFHGLRISKNLYTDHFEICCPQIQGLIIPSYACIAPVTVDAISSCSDLLGLTIQRVLLCIVAVVAILGNITVILYRVVWDRSVLKTGYGLFVTNLGISDFIMGIYLFIIVVADNVFRDNYVLYDKNWRNSAVCKFAGFIACLSCEASTFFVFLITLDRFLVIKFPFGQIKCSRFMKTLAVTVSWVASVVLSLVPIVFSFDIYSSNSMCLGLPLTNKQVKGWEYAVAVFIIYNFVMFLLIAYGQYSIFRAMSENRISKTVASMSRSRRAEDITVGKQLSLVVLSNFLFWFPVGFMGLMALGGHEVSTEVYTWTTVLLLPINSAINPVLYTIPALMAGWEKFKHGDHRTFSSS